ncbi:xylose isomerase-like protein [Punctularia strigosozonata HHB-11173 SS5]|uniref:xylose isomerase-like protein n=1 Tax=Punctularia strigosozonata (strain HHB-11173) TaxID=741275 RepID=UPI000441651B|nr:xylose isomerase-like protein [Punctularia strigosozonata HHB-11173 SS5]EIN12948.1 xylose isomerase-like protein [Punctularia strigosozonata HHB-11173 SS5]
MLAYATASAGMHPSHTLALKLRVIADAGFNSVEIAFPDLEAFAQSEYPDYGSADRGGKGDVDTLLKAANRVRDLCRSMRLSVLTLMPFSQFEGYPDPSKHAESLSRARTWLQVAQTLGAEMLQVGSSNDPESSPDRDVIVKDFRDLAEEAAKVNVKMCVEAYEMWAWGVHNNTWQDVLAICAAVDRPNFGVCFDTFQICARAYADPTAPNRQISSMAPLQLASSLKDLVAALEADGGRMRDKVFYFQISDGSLNVSPQDLVKSAKEQGLPPLYAWSNSWRPIPYQDATSYGGYLPVVDVVEAVLRSGWRGPMSYEVRHALPSQVSRRILC